LANPNWEKQGERPPFPRATKLKNNLLYFVNIYTLDCIIIHMSKLSRQQAILDLVKAEELTSQDELRKHLVRKGFRVTQATLSRDINELGLVKTAEGYSLLAAENGNGHGSESGVPPVARLIREFVTEIREAQNLLVLKTSAGSAQPVALALDAESWREVVGTVGGDDTVLIVSSDKKSAGRLASRIREMLA
jgi:transcriptional regulator of arginine metabolism